MATTRIRSKSEQKRALREHHAAHPDMSRQELSEWAASAFKLPRPLARTSLTDLLKRTDDDTEINPLRKGSHCVHSPQLEAHLVRNGLKSRRTHDEAGSAKTAAVEDGHRVQQAVASQYDKKDIYSMDETAYFYCSIPDKIISKNSISGRKKIKKRLTVAVTSNADGSTKLPLLFVGTVRQPRCFGGKSANELGFQYANAAKG